MTMYSTTFSASQFEGSATRLGHILLAAQCMEQRKSRGARYVSGVGEADRDGNYGCATKSDRGRGRHQLVQQLQAALPSVWHLVASRP